MKRLFFAVLLFLTALPSLAQVPPAVPALPDTERRTSYSLSASQCNCAVNFALYGDGGDFQNWIEVFLNGTQVQYNDPNFGWKITSPSGTVSAIARPITDAVFNFSMPQTGTVQIVGARRPRRTAQFAENRGVAARDLNQALTDVVAQNREAWDKINDVSGRGLFSQPGNTMALLPLPAACQNSLLGLGANGLTPTCTGISSITTGIVGPGSTTSGDMVTWASTNGSAVGDGPLGSGVLSALSHGINTTGGIATVPVANCQRIEAFGGGTGVSDNGVPLNSALSSLSAAGGCIQFGPGIYNFTTAVSYTFQNGPASLAVVGAGQEGTILAWASPTTAITINYASPRNSFHFRDLSVTTGTASNSTVALRLIMSTADATQAAAAVNDVTNVQFHGSDGYALTDYWGTGVFENNVSNVNFYGDSFIGPSGIPGANSGTGIFAEGNSSLSSWINGPNITNCIFGGLTYGIETGQNTFYITFTGNTFAVVANGIVITVLGIAAEIEGNEFVTTSGGIVANTTGAQCNPCQIMGNAFSLNGVALAGVFIGSTVVGNWFDYNPQGPAGSTAAVQLSSGSASNVISGNIIVNLTTGIANLAGSTGLNVQSNIYGGNTTNISNAGSINVGGSCSGIGGTCTAGATN